MLSYFQKKWFPYFLLGLATLLVWGQTVTFDFVWDDTFFIRDLPSVRSLRHVPEMFTRLDAQSSFPEGFVLFRPLRTLQYALLHALTGAEVPQPWIYHLANVLWHGATAMMLFATLLLLLPKLVRELPEAETRNWSLIIALAFAVHPVVSEVVCWAKSLDDIMAAFFTLAALWQLLKTDTDPRAVWRGWLFFALAVYSKESAVPYALIPFFVLRKIQGQSWRDCVRATVPYLLVAAVYVVHRHLVIGRSSQTSPISGTYLQTLLDMFPMVTEYVRLLFGVPPFFIDYSYQHGGYALGSSDVLIGLLLLAVMSGAAVLTWRSSRWGIVGFGLGWTGLFLLPVSNLVPMMQYMAERFLYLPLIGWLMALGGLALLAAKRDLFRELSIGLILVWALTAWNRSWIWKDEVTLFVRSAQEGPKTERVENNAIAAIIHLPHIAKVFSYDDRQHKLLVNGTLDPSSKDAVMRTFEQAYGLFPENDVVNTCLGISFAMSGQPAKALPYFEKAVQLRPKNLDYVLNLSRAALDAGQFEKAAQALDRADLLAPEQPMVLQLRFKLHWQKQDYLAARAVAVRWAKAAPGQESSYWLRETEQKVVSPGQR